jgi:hypothetical protein
MRFLRSSAPWCAAVVMALALSPAAAFAHPLNDTAPCTGDSVSGTVVAVDESTSTVTIELADSTLCTVSLAGTYNQPIITLLGTHFETLTAQSLSDALNTLQVQVDCSSTPCTLVDSGGTSATVVSVTDNGDGTYSVVLAVDDGAGGTTLETITIDDSSLAGTWMGALNDLTVNWPLKHDDSGGAYYVGVEDEIANLHSDGMGFGVIVKLYALAAEAQQACSSLPEGTTLDPGTPNPCDVTVESLAADFKSGVGMGILFKLYGKPDILGVGHVRNGVPDHGNSDHGNQGSKGICKAQSHGGQANGHGHAPVTCTEGN